MLTIVLVQLSDTLPAELPILRTDTFPAELPILITDTFPILITDTFPILITDTFPTPSLFLSSSLLNNAVFPEAFSIFNPLRCRDWKNSVRCTPRSGCEPNQVGAPLRLGRPKEK